MAFRGLSYPKTYFKSYVTIFNYVNKIYHFFVSALTIYLYQINIMALTLVLIHTGSVSPPLSNIISFNLLGFSLSDKMIKPK